MFDIVTIPGLPERLHDTAARLINYGFGIRGDAGGWLVTYPPRDPSGYGHTRLSDSDLEVGLRRILRVVENRRGDLITPSALDRLIDYEPEHAREAPASRTQTLRDLKNSVRRDLEWLLNTRQVVGGVPEGLKELSRSLAAYGLPDFSSVSVKSPSDQTRMERALEAAIRDFEPRLQDVKVTLMLVRDTEQKMRFRIDARLRVPPAPEPVTFDTVLQGNSNQYVVKAE
jgi:type VI secretion system protein ImpF